jgi:hypothetical protein
MKLYMVEGDSREGHRHKVFIVANDEHEAVSHAAEMLTIAPPEHVYELPAPTKANAGWNDLFNMKQWRARRTTGGEWYAI